MKSWMTNKPVALALLAASLSSFSTAHAQDTLLITDAEGGKVVRFEYSTGTAFDHFVGDGLSAMGNSTFMCLSTVSDLVFVSSSNTNRIMAYNKFTGERYNNGDDNGVFIEDSTNLDRPFGLAASTKNHSLYVSSHVNGSIFEYSGTDGTYIGELDVTLDRPEGLVLTPDSERLYVADFYAHKVYFYNWDSINNEYNTRGSIDFTGHTLINPTGLAADSSNNIYVSQRGVAPLHDDGTVLKITPAGVVSVFAAGPFERIRDVTIDFSDNLVISHLDGISVFNSAGVDQSYAFTASAGGLGEHNGLLLLNSGDTCVHTDCVADINGDDVLNFYDISAFLDAFTNQLGCD